MAKVSKKQLEILYDCWKNAETYKDRVLLVEEKLPKMSPILALKTMRQRASTDPKWIGWATRQKNKELKEKEARSMEVERKKKEKEGRAEDLRIKRERREKIKSYKNDRESISSVLSDVNTKEITDNIKCKFFFCKDVGQHMRTDICIFRVFADDPDYAPGGPCAKCTKMDKHIPKLKEIIKDDDTK